MGPLWPKKEKNMRKRTQNVVRLTVTASLLAITILLQAMAGFIVIPITNTSPALSLIPIAVGAIIYGPSCGALLGLGWSLFILASGQASGYMAMNMIGTIITVIAKGTLAGIGSGYVFKLLKEKNVVVAIIAASIVTPLINSLVYRVCLLIFFQDYFFGKASSEGMHPVAYFMKAFIAGGFFIEVGISTIFSPIVVRICDICFSKLGIPLSSKSDKNK